MLKKIIHSTRGFTIMELVIVISIMSILLALAVPPYIRWRENSQYRQTAKAVFFLMRDARSRAIEANRQYLVEIDTANSRCRMMQGSAPINSLAWNDFGLGGWTNASQNVFLNAAANSLVFNPNGSATTTLSVDIRDSGGANRWWVDVQQATGRIRVERRE